MLQDVLAKIDASQEQSLNSLFELLRFKSIATDPAYFADTRACADWLKTYFEDMGLKVALMPTIAQPAIVARLGMEKTQLPHVLFYGHYDVQPVDPLNLWTTPPFEPAVRNEKIYARGAADDKGQLMTFVEAVKAWLATHGELPFRLTLLIEGDEEGDAAVMEEFLKEQGEALHADIAMICDTDMWDNKTPGITTSLRGCIAEDVTVTAPKLDLHSGYFGGPARNPLKALSHLIDKLHDKKGRIVIPGFYDGMKKISAKKRNAWADLKFTEKELLSPIGLKKSSGEAGIAMAEQIWAQPTVEVNGFWGGYTGVGSKTVLPAKAEAKFSFRLIDGQDPKKVRKAFRKFMKDNLPPDCKISFFAQGGDSYGISVDEKNPWLTQAADALSEEWGVKCALMGSGVSIPVVENFRRFQKMESLLVGFGRSDDAVHSPNENYDVESYVRGTRSWARIFAKVAEGKLK